ncbi:MAG: glycosyltransferase [Candidatus Paceibacterota bacterium]
MKSNPKISVLMSVYDGAKYLEESIKSIQNQTFSDFEFIIVNDASTDNSLEIIKNFSDPRIIILNNPKNLGLTKSLNIGLKQASGEYIARLDADDLSFPERLEKQLSFMEKNEDFALVGSSAVLINEEGKIVGKKNKPIEFFEIKFHSLLKNPFLHPSLFFKKEILAKVGNYNENFSFAQDYELTSRLINLGYKVSNLSEPLIKYRLENNSITGNKETRKIQLVKALEVSFNNCSCYYNFKKENIISLIKGVNKEKTGFFEMIFNLINLYRLKSSFLKKEKSIQKEKIISIYKSEQKSVISSFLKPSINS